MTTNSQHTSGFYRLVALWVVIETFIGGIIHSFSLPISGLFVASGACICLCLIGISYNSKAIVKATLLVCLFKLMLSPQAPPTAYIAVGFQGLVAYLLFLSKRYYTAKCFVLAILALVESGMQKIIVLTVLYGNTFYTAVNEFASKLIHAKQQYNFSLIIAAIYLIIHLFAAIILAFFLKKLPTRILRWKQKYTVFGETQIAETRQPISIKSSQKRYRKLIYASVVFFLLILLFYVSNQIKSESKILFLLQRFFLIIAIWYFVVKPLALFLLEKVMLRYKQKNTTSINLILNLLPDIVSVVKLCQKEAIKEKTVMGRIRLFTKLVIINIV